MNLAVRLKDQARAGQVLATEALIHLAGQVEGLAYIERGLVHPKGYDVPVHVVQVTAAGQEGREFEDADEPELRTFMFTDVVGYFNFVAQHSDAFGADLQRRHSQLVETVIRAHGGRVLQIAGDESFIVFVPPRQAVRAAIALQEQFERTFVQELQLPLRLKIGIEMGEAIPLMGQYAGAAVFLGVRICQMAEPGEILIGEALSHLVRKLEGLILTDRGQVQVPGYADPVRVFRVASA